MSKFLAPFGIRHELAKRYTFADWIKANKIKKLMDSKNSDDLISDLIRLGKPGLVGRLGGTEARFIGEYLKLKRLDKFRIPVQLTSKLSPRWKKRSSDIYSLSGFYFDSWKEIDLFCKTYIEALSETDILGAWGVAFTWVEGVSLKRDKTKVIPVGFTSPWVEPYVSTNTAWSGALQGKKVLVVSGFATSILSQHNNITRVFQGIDYPDFKLQVVRAPIVTGERDPEGLSWFDLLEKMKREISTKDFDVALIAAGAFSYPLAAYAKKLGKIGIHCGGGLQIFFGVMGNRWNNSPEVLKYVNEFWVRPSANERPKRADQVENACYW